MKKIWKEDTKITFNTLNIKFIFIKTQHLKDIKKAQTGRIDKKQSHI